MRNGEKNYHFIEVMACPGGCINGGGQPLQPAQVRNFTDIKGKRAAALYRNDAAKTLRKSHESPAVKAVYAEYFTEPGSHLAHKILHTSYVKRGPVLIPRSEKARKPLVSGLFAACARLDRNGRIWYQ